MFVNIRSRTEMVRRVRASITADAEPLTAGGDRLQPIYIEATYRFDSFTGAEDHDVAVTFRFLRRNGTVGDREVTSTWKQAHPDIPKWAAAFLSAHMPQPEEVVR